MMITTLVEVEHKSISLQPFGTVRIIGHSRFFSLLLMENRRPQKFFVVFAKVIMRRFYVDDLQRFLNKAPAIKPVTCDNGV